ncbi:MAG: YbgC/FadM family acyl-CoA thioesterase [Gammaproteobacteria bacterium]|nr:YbgC/FadM family acyl-CoA thioesterase [Gammaproteobacteria bacterium]
MSKEFIFPIRVYYEDTDAEGVVYHANYLNFMERARSEWCRTLGVQLSDLAEEGILTAVRAAHLEYLRPAQLDDLLEVVTSVEEVSRVKITFKHVVRFADTPDEIICKGLVTVVSLDRKMRPCRMLPKIVEGMTGDN